MNCFFAARPSTLACIGAVFHNTWNVFPRQQFVGWVCHAQKVHGARVNHDGQ